MNICEPNIEMKVYKILFFLSVFALPSFIFTQNLNENHSKIRYAVEQEGFADALHELKNLQKEKPKVFTANNYDYLLARLSEKQGDFANAAANYQAVVNRNSVLKEYALWHLSQIMRSSGNLLMERLYLQELSLIAEKSLLRNAVNERSARSYFESGNYGAAIKLVSDQWLVVNGQQKESKNIIEEIKEIPLSDENHTREDSVLLADAYLLNKQTDKAREIFSRLVNNPPNKNQPDDFALIGVKALDLLEVGKENFGKSAPNLSAEEHFRRAEIYQFNRNFPLARTHYEAIVANHPTSTKVPISLYQIGRGYEQRRNHHKAAEWFERLQAEHSEDEIAAAALYQTANAYANLNKTHEAISRYSRYISENPDAENLERAYLNIVDAYRDSGESTTALKWSKKIQEIFKGESGEAVALFTEARIHLSQQDWQNALKNLNVLSSLKNLGVIGIAGGTNKQEVNFLKGFVLEKLGRFDKAIDTYLLIEDGLKNYYGWRASERLQELGKDEKTANLIRQNFRRFSNIADETLTNKNAFQIKDAAQKAFRLTENQKTKDKLLARISDAYTLLPTYKKIPNGKILEFGRTKLLMESSKNLTPKHKNIADELLFLGLYDEATPELETFLRQKLAKNTGSLSDFSESTAFTLAVFYKRGDAANRAFEYIEPLWRKVPADLQIELIPREVLELLYPKPYRTSLQKHEREKRVDPRFILAIMRQESRFAASVKSAAAARGLMQFISTTALKTADEMNVEDFHQDDLYNPPTAIRFGSRYISKIFAVFPNQPAAVAAGYNAGEDRMMRWLRRANSINPNRYVPEIVFIQTKDYVYKVLENYRVYQMLYDENLKNTDKLQSQFK